MQESHSTVSDGLRLCQLLPNDFNAVMEYLVNQFIPHEPLAKAIAMTAEDAWSMNEEVVKAALSSSLSYAFRTCTDEIVAVRLCSTVERPTGDEISGVFSGIDSTSKSKMTHLPRSAYEVTRILSALESQTWRQLAPEVRSLMSLLIISTHEQYLRRGLMKKLLNVDEEQLKHKGIQGVITEATAFKSQALLKKHGYKMLYEIKHDEWLDSDGKPIFKCTDGTNSAQLLFKKF
uniref:aralkylamine N-acetyltransferase n=1 Tax=Ascaris lumbricoides TaxID=6252 RepID=A0A0M3I9S6_ASCLU